MDFILTGEASDQAVLMLVCRTGDIVGHPRHLQLSGEQLAEMELYRSAASGHTTVLIRQATVLQSAQ